MGSRGAVGLPFSSRRQLLLEPDLKVVARLTVAPSGAARRRLGLAFADSKGPETNNTVAADTVTIPVSTRSAFHPPSAANKPADIPRNVVANPATLRLSLQHSA